MSTNCEVEAVPPELADLAREINHHHVEAARAAGAAVNHACKAGERLIEAKAMLPHGQWLSWLEANCQVSERSAQAYMRVARELPKLEGLKAQRIADLPLRQLLDFIAEPKPELPSATLRETIIDEHRILWHCLDNPLAPLLPRRDTPEHFRELLNSCKDRALAEVTPRAITGSVTRDSWILTLGPYKSYVGAARSSWTLPRLGGTCL